MAGEDSSTWERIKKPLETSRSTSYFERYSSPQTHPGGGVWRTLVQKLRVLGVFLLRRLSLGPGRRQALRGLAALAGSASQIDVLVIGSGPSAATLNTREVAKRQRDGELIVIATNFYLGSTLAKTITPDYLVWADDIFDPRHRSDNSRSWELLEDTPGVTVIAPWTWQASIAASHFAPRFIYFDNDTLETLSSNISPLRPRGYQGTAGAKALAIAVHLAPRQVFIIGLDHSTFQSFSVNEDNRVLRKPKHLTGTDSGVADITPHTINGLADSLYSAANELLYFRTHFAGHRVTNLDPHSMVDAFPKVTAHPLVKKARRPASR